MFNAKGAETSKVEVGDRRFDKSARSNITLGKNPGQCPYTADSVLSRHKEQKYVLPRDCNINRMERTTAIQQDRSSKDHRTSA